MHHQAGSFLGMPRIADTENWQKKWKRRAQVSELSLLGMNSLLWKGFEEEVSFDLVVKEWRMKMTVFLAHHDGMVSACCLQVRNTVICEEEWVYETKWVRNYASEI